MATGAWVAGLAVGLVVSMFLEILDLFYRSLGEYWSEK